MYFCLKLFLFNCSIVSIYITLDHIFTLSRRDLPNVALDIKYTSLDPQDFYLTFTKTTFFVKNSIMFNLYLLDARYFFFCTIIFLMFTY